MPTHRYKTESKFETRLVSVKLTPPFIVTLQPLVYRYGPAPENVHIVPKYKLTDRASNPWVSNLIKVSKDDLDEVGVLHDDLRDALHCSNMLTDGYLYDASLSIGKSYFQSLAIFGAVRLGTALRYSTEFSIETIDEGCEAVSEYLGIPEEHIEFNHNLKTYQIINHEDQ